MAFDPCRPVRLHLSDSLDAQPLPLVVGLLVRLHLTICPPCRRVHRSLAATRDALRTLRDIDPTDSL
jgi:predicted anti-sigma-YlaC factor YlaD